MGWSSPPPYAPPPPPPPAIDQTQVKQKAAAGSQAYGTQQDASGQGGVSTMLTEGTGIDPSILGKKTLLGG